MNRSFSLKNVYSYIFFVYSPLDVKLVTALPKTSVTLLVFFMAIVDISNHLQDPLKSFVQDPMIYLKDFCHFLDILFVVGWQKFYRVFKAVICQKMCVSFEFHYSWKTIQQCSGLHK